MGPIRTFLKAVERLARNGDITIEDAYRFAKQQFGEVSDLMKLQINRLFKKKPDPGTRKQEKNNVVTFVPKDKLRPAQMEEEGLGIESLKNPRRPGGSLDPLEGMTRTAARVVLGRKGIKIPDRADPIDVFEENFGGDALMDLKNVADELLEKETTGNITESMGKFLESEGMFDLKINKDAPKALSNKELLDLMEEAETEDILKKFDPEDREPNSKGGINRVGFAKGKIKLVQFLAGKGLDLAKEIRKSVDDIFETGDTKYDADVVVEDMVERLGIDRDVVDQRDLLDAYDEAYKMLVSDKRKNPFADTGLEKLGKALDEEGIDPKDTILPTRSFKGTEIKDPTFDEGMPFDNDAEKLAEIKMSNENFDEMTPKLKERFALKEKYPGLDDELLTAIVDDPDPDNKAQVLATLDTLMELQRQGKTPEEAVDIIKRTMFTGRKDNAEGGLNYLMGM